VLGLRAQSDRSARGVRLRHRAHPADRQQPGPGPAPL